MWDLIVLFPDRCISIYLVAKREESRGGHLPRRVLQVSVFFLFDFHLPISYFSACEFLISVLPLELAAKEHIKHGYSSFYFPP